MNNVFYNLEAERNILGLILLDNNNYLEVVNILSPEDFYFDKHKLIYKSMQQLFSKSSPIDLINLSNHLGNNLPEAGGLTYISVLINSVINTHNIVSYADIVKEKSRLRMLDKMLKAVQNYMYKEIPHSMDIINNIQSEISAIEKKSSAESGEIKLIMEEFIDLLELRWKDQGSLQGISTGYKFLDNMLEGFLKQDFIILAARPSMGKTSMALNLALNAALNGKASVAFFNLEMGKIQIVERALSICSNIPAKAVKKAQFDDRQWVEAVQFSSTLANSALFLYDKIYTLQGIRAQCKKLKIQNNLRVVFIDYLQLILNTTRTENRNQDISKISRDLKLLAKELDITIIALSQLSRAPEARLNHRPVLSDLRDSGSIEQDADAVLFLYRDEYYNRDTDDKDIMECIVSKNRNGSVGIKKMKWHKATQKIFE
ncbi:replicative DNA helicase [Clostridium sp. JN-9]|uniref:replicative DNA helicase n=1 Tax=Clostridium sp. JN-9 TaxID=2507159 RepID=UPI000FFDF965|nr:replicative DNA helicase [Clostridium sp. JN-9]QAT40993.1 replicative DNA helicase [Clostridium sp. JN-9]